MQNVRFFILQPVGSGRVRKEGSWADVLEAIPYLLYPQGPIPPRKILNDILRSGVRHAGMSGGCAWEPAELDEGDYEETAEELLGRTGKGYKRLEAPEWVRAEEDFNLWAAEVAYGLPAVENRELLERNNQLLQSIRDALDQGDAQSGNSALSASPPIAVVAPTPVVVDAVQADPMTFVGPATGPLGAPAVPLWPPRTSLADGADPALL